MKLILSYPISKPFSPRYSTVIVFVFSLSLAAIVTWTFMTEKDCLFVTRDVYDNGICKPHNINNGDILRRTRDGGEEPISYHVSISGLSHEYPYVNNNFDCGAIVNFAIVLNSDWTVAISYVASCNIQDEARTNFTLIANTVVANISFSTDAELRLVTCHGVKTPVQSLLFYKDLGATNPIYIGPDLDPNICTLNVRQNYIDKYSKNTTLAQYFEDKYNEASELGIISPWARFRTGYPCSDCKGTSPWKRLLGLLTVLCSIGANVYSILIFLAERMYKNSSNTDLQDDSEDFIPLDEIAEDGMTTQ